MRMTMRNRFHSTILPLAALAIMATMVAAAPARALDISKMLFQIRDRFQIHGTILANGRMRATACFHPSYALCRKRALANQEFSVFACIDIVRNNGDTDFRRQLTA